MTTDDRSTTRYCAPARKTWLLASTLLACGALASANAQTGDAARGQAAYVVCQACHGANAEGNKDLNAPRLAGLAAADLTRQIENFKNGARGYDASDAAAAQMKPIVQTLASAQAIADVVAYIGTLKAPAPAATVTGNAGAGATAYAICGACHGAAGEGNTAQNAPKLAGQHDWYVVKQLQNFKSGIRGKGPGDTFGPTMAPMALTLPDDAAIANVAAYIATLKE
jgi:cytochrome c oxidase subunit 2